MNFIELTCRLNLLDWNGSVPGGSTLEHVVCVSGLCADEARLVVIERRRGNRGEQVTRPGETQLTAPVQTSQEPNKEFPVDLGYAALRVTFSALVRWIKYQTFFR